MIAADVLKIISGESGFIVKDLFVYDGHFSL